MDCSKKSTFLHTTEMREKEGKEMKRKERNLMKVAVASAMIVSLAPFMKPNVVLAYDAIQQQKAQDSQNVSSETTPSTDSSQLIQKNDENQTQPEAEKTEEQAQEAEKEESPKTVQQQSSEQETLASNQVQTVQPQSATSGVSDEEAVAKIGGTNYASLKQAVDEAQNGETIVVTKSIYVNEEVKVVNKNITIKGLNNKVTLYRADSYLNGYLLNIDENSTVTLENINYDGGASGFKTDEVTQGSERFLTLKFQSTDLKASKSMIYSSGKLIGKNSSFKNALIADGDSRHGGAIYIAKGGAEFENCNFEHNAIYRSAWAYGGAIFTASIDYLKFTNTNFNHNYAAYSGASINFGGAVFSDAEKMEVYGGMINDNYASENGGALYSGHTTYNVRAKTVIMKNVDFYRNRCGQNGSVIYLRTSSGYFTDCTCVDNTGSDENSTGDTICFAYAKRPVGVIKDCKFKRSDVGKTGAVIDNYGSPFELTVDNCDFEDTTGDVLYLPNTKLALTNSRFERNSGKVVTLYSYFSDSNESEYSPYLNANIENCQFLGNKNMDLFFTNSTKYNEKKVYTATIKDTLIDGQNVDSERQSIYAYSGSNVSLDNVEIKNKKVKGYHGVGICAYGTDTVVNLRNGSSIHANSGNGSAGIAALDGAHINVDETSKVYDNDSLLNSGDIYLKGKESQISFYKDSVIGEKLLSSCGHTIDGWYIDVNGNKYNEQTGNVVKLPNDSKQIVLKNKDTYGLKAAHDIYSVTYNANYGDNKEVKTDSLAPGSKVKLSSTLFDRDKYVFTGWNTKADGTGEAYRYDAKTGKFVDGDEIEVPAHDVTLYAQWAFKMVKINAVPTIKAEDKVINVGDEFNPLDGVTASDTEDGDLTSEVKVIKNTVDTSKSGTYEITYEATDKDGVKVTKTIKVTVKEKDKENVTITPSKDNDNKGNTTRPGQSSSTNNSSNNNNQNTSPKTGDATQTGLFALLLSFSGMLLGLLKRKKTKESGLNEPARKI